MCSSDLEVSYHLNELLGLAERLYQSGEWDHAEAKFNLVLLQCDAEGQLAGFHQRATIGKARCLTAKALQLKEKGNTSEAAGLIKQALELDPTNKKLARLAEEIKEEKTFVRENHATVLFENDDFLLLRPLTHRGSLKYGANTKWCTASKTSPSTFERYIQSNYLFYLIRKNQKNTKWDKVAFLFRKSQEVFGDCSMYDANDNCCSDSSLKKSDWSIVDIIKFETICRIFCAQQREIERARSVVNHFKT